MTYIVKKAVKIFNNKQKKSWFICNPIIPVYHVCKFLDLKGKNSEHTQKTYASVLTQWLNYLQENRKKQYFEIESQDIKKYFHKLIFFNKDNQFVITPELTYKTLKLKHTIIFEFYKFLLGECETNYILVIDNKKYNFNLKLDKFDRDAKNAIHYYMTKYKLSRKENYILEYTEDDIKVICSNFNFIRDKIVFLLTVFGIRVDEVLSIKISEFNFSENLVKPSRSKSYNKRTIVISSELSKMINNYIQTERMNAIYKSGLDSEYLFVNLNAGKYCGKELKYQTFYTSLKRAGVNAGYKFNSIRTHSGRSTRAMELLKQGVSDEMIRHIMGWKNSSSIKEYIDHNNKSLAIEGAKFLANTNKKGYNGY